MFSETKDEMLDQYGIVKCNRQNEALLDPAWIVGRRESKFDVELLVRPKEAVRRAQPQLLLETASIDDIMTFFAKEHTGK